MQGEWPQHWQCGTGSRTPASSPKRHDTSEPIFVSLYRTVQYKYKLKCDKNAPDVPGFTKEYPDREAMVGPVL